jgi:hypothetical protein
MKPRKNASVMLWLGLSLTLAGCQSPSPQIPRAMQDNVTPLLNHPQFREAAQAAPEFTEAALSKIIELSK